MFDWFPVSFRGRMACLIGSLYLLEEEWHV